MQRRVAARLETGIRSSTVRRALAAIVFKHREAEIEQPSLSDARAVVAGALRKRKEKSLRRDVLLPDDLRKVCHRLVKRRGASGSRLPATAPS